MSEHEAGQDQSGQDETTRERPGLWAAGSHPVNIGHLVMGLTFLGMVAAWALWTGDVVEEDDLGWLLPVPWVIAGAVGLLATTLNEAASRERWER